MKLELEKKLQKNYPEFFNGMYLPPDQSCMSFGCEHGDGWYNILDELCQEIEKLKLKNFHFHQIKEKFGELRIYTNYNTEKIDELIRQAEIKSAHTCEICGEPGEISSDGYWLSARCNKCRCGT